MNKDNAILSVSIDNLVDYNDIENSLLIKAVREFFDFPQSLHGFELVRETEHYVEIKFFNYQKTNCSVIYQKDFNQIRLNKGIGGVNFDYLTLINNLIKLGIFTITSK